MRTCTKRSFKTTILLATLLFFVPTFAQEAAITNVSYPTSSTAKTGTLEPIIDPGISTCDTYLTVIPLESGKNLLMVNESRFLNIEMTYQLGSSKTTHRYEQATSSHPVLPGCRADNKILESQYTGTITVTSYKVTTMNGDTIDLTSVAG